MPVKHILTAILSLAIVFTVLTTACTQATVKEVVYDTSKDYVSFIVVNAGNSGDLLENAKTMSKAQGFEIGPVQFYEPGATDFTAIAKGVTPSPQIKLIWIIGSLLDSPKIQKALDTSGYRGGMRYMPVTSTIGK
jgi:hypothetical protein